MYIFFRNKNISMFSKVSKLKLKNKKKRNSLKKSNETFLIRFFVILQILLAFTSKWKKTVYETYKQDYFNSFSNNERCFTAQILHYQKIKTNCHKLFPPSRSVIQFYSTLNPSSKPVTSLLSFVISHLTLQPFTPQQGPYSQRHTPLRQTRAFSINISRLIA